MSLHSAAGRARTSCRALRHWFPLYVRFQRPDKAGLGSQLAESLVDDLADALLADPFAPADGLQGLAVKLPIQASGRPFVEHQRQLRRQFWVEFLIRLASAFIKHVE